MGAVPQIAGHLLDRFTRAACARVVEQDVQRPEPIGGGLHEGGDLPLLHHVATLVDRTVAEFGGQRRATLVLDVGDDHARTLGHEQLDRGLADAAGAACDQRRLAA